MTTVTTGASTRTLAIGAPCPERIALQINGTRRFVSVPIFDPRVRSDHVFGLVEVEAPLPWQFEDRRWLTFTHPDGRRVIVSAAYYSDGRPWLHLSVARAHKMPSYRDLKQTKNELLGKDRKAIQLFVPEDEHYSLHPFCLHLFSCLAGDPYPDFRNERGQV